MGQMLSEPVTAKESAFCQSSKYLVGSSCMQGWRVNMEDAHTHILSLPDDQTASFFAVYDGHGGAGVAQYAGQNLHKILVKRPEYKYNIQQALKMAYLEIDDIMYNDKNLVNAGGSTALSCLIKDNKLYCANAGDSRMMASIDGDVDVLSIDHKPNDIIELDRICKAGGFVKYNRVNGILSLSRALGDFKFKIGSYAPEHKIITANPGIEVRDLNDNWEFAVLACDGIWDVMSNSQVRSFCRERIAMGLYPDKICEELINHCLAPDCRMGGRGSDNMTVILVCFLHDKPYSELSNRCSVMSNSVLIDDPLLTWLDTDNNDDYQEHGPADNFMAAAQLSPEEMYVDSEYRDREVIEELSRSMVISTNTNIFNTEIPNETDSDAAIVIDEEVEIIEEFDIDGEELGEKKIQTLNGSSQMIEKNNSCEIKAEVANYHELKKVTANTKKMENDIANDQTLEKETPSSRVLENQELTNQRLEKEIDNKQTQQEKTEKHTQKKDNSNRENFEENTTSSQTLEKDPLVKENTEGLTNEITTISEEISLDKENICDQLFTKEKTNLNVQSIKEQIDNGKIIEANGKEPLNEANSTSSEPQATRIVDQENDEDNTKNEKKNLYRGTEIDLK